MIPLKTEQELFFDTYYTASFDMFFERDISFQNYTTERSIYVSDTLEIIHSIATSTVCQKFDQLCGSHLVIL